MSWALQVWISWEVSIVNLNFMRAKHCKLEFYDHKSWAFVNVNSMSAERCDSEFKNDSFPGHCKYECTRADHCECEFYDSWECECKYSIKFNFANVKFMRAKHCKWKLYGS